MISQIFRSALLAAAIAISGIAVVSARAEDNEKNLPSLAAALKDAKVNLVDGLKASEREGKPISAKFEIDDGKLQLSVYTMKADGFAKVVVDPKTGAIAKAENITDAEDLAAAATQKAAMEKATISLAAATQKSAYCQHGIPCRQHHAEDLGGASDCGHHIAAGRDGQESR